MFPLPLHPTIPHTLVAPLLSLTNILALAIGPQHRVLQLWFSLPVLAFLAAQSVGRDYAGTWGIYLAVNSGVASLLGTYVDWVLLKSPDREGWVKRGRRVGRDGSVESNGDAKNAAPTGFRSRLWWATRLACTLRYTGWSCEVKNVPVEVDDDYPRWLFLLRKSLRALLFYFLKDILFSFTASSPHGSWLDIAHLKPAVPFTAYTFWYRFAYTWTYIVLTCVSLELYNTVAGIVSVGAGLARPSECPSAFGDLRGLWSVRRAWSVVWHQQCRRLCSAPGIFVVRDVLRLRKGSFASKYLQLFIAFGISGLVHGGASMLCHGSFDDDRAIKAFVGQAVIVLVEDHVIELGKHLGFKDSRFWRSVGFFWTVLAVGASMESWTGMLLKHGIWVHDRGLDWLGIGPKVR